MNQLSTLLLLISLLLSTTYQSVAQSNILDETTQAVQSLKLRSIGPALMGGRIADIAISPSQPSTWYVAAGSGNLWKTSNAGITWQPVFDHQTSYSIGTVSIDPNNAETIWVGTGENVSGRHVGWGDGVYKSTDGGKTWTNKGLKRSEHIGKILIDPRNSDVVFVAAEGPLWSTGGERGLYKSEDGGDSWELVLKIDENTGVTDMEFDPSDPDVIYAAAYQRRRKVWSLLGGGPNSGIYKSTDNGANWRKVSTGLPKGDIGKIGLAVTPANPKLVYATIEANNAEKGFYRSTDKGESWEKRNSYISGGTGPHYYQEIEVSPQNPDLIYQMDVFLHVSRDGGKTFDYLVTGREKHSDNHALWIDPNNGQHLIAGTDAGLYESFDEGAHWRHFPNLPISQFYKLGLDNSEPFYNIIGGAQDLGTLIGPSRTMNTEGVRNRDWYVPLGADGYDSHFDPEDPNIAYMEIQ
ncbi:MAG: glycosyl hydrolase, partial [Bacteroidota bacterium]